MIRELLRDALLWLDPGGQAFWRLRRTLLAWITLACAGLILFSLQSRLHRLFFFLDWSGFFPGGALLQSVLPAVCYFALLRRRQPRAADVCLLWFGAGFLGYDRALAVYLGCFVMAYSVFSFWRHCLKDKDEA